MAEVINLMSLLSSVRIGCRSAVDTGEKNISDDLQFKKLLGDTLCIIRNLSIALHGQFEPLSDRTDACV